MVARRAHARLRRVPSRSETARKFPGALICARQLHLNVSILHLGFSPAAWRVDGVDPHAAFDVNHYVNVARIAEAAKLDAIFLADQAAISDRILCKIGFKLV